MPPSVSSPRTPPHPPILAPNPEEEDSLVVFVSNVVFVSYVEFVCVVVFKFVFVSIIGDIGMCAIPSLHSLAKCNTSVYHILK